MLKNDGFSIFLPYISEPRGSNATFTLVISPTATFGLVSNSTDILVF